VDLGRFACFGDLYGEESFDENILKYGLWYGLGYFFSYNGDPGSTGLFGITGLDRLGAADLLLG
jgi:hypothetical protein